jgi:hypothetical protein
MNSIYQEQQVMERGCEIRTRLTPEKSVRFLDRLQVKTSLHIHHNYTDDECEACWYKRPDYRCFEKEIKYTADLVERNLDIDDALYCRRVIECRTKSTLRMQNKTAVRDAVLETQKVSRNAEVISGVYLMGISDAKIADAPDSLGKSQRQDERFNISTISRHMGSNAQTSGCRP